MRTVERVQFPNVIDDFGVAVAMQRVAGVVVDKKQFGLRSRNPVTKLSSVLKKKLPVNSGQVNTGSLPMSSIRTKPGRPPRCETSAPA